jgi:hypothetical protein
MQVRQRPFWNGRPEEIREVFALTKADRATARCVLWSHEFGWELRLTVGGSLVRSQVAREFADILTATEEWKSEMIANGWSAPPS